MSKTDETRKGTGWNRRLFSAFIVAFMILSSVFIAFPMNLENAKGAGLQHSIANIQFTANDNGRINDLYWNSIRQTAHWAGSDYLGLVIDHDGYDHVTTDADGIFITDFIDGNFDNVITPITFEEDTPAEQMSVAKYSHTALDPGDINLPQSNINDVEVEQTVWTFADANWALIQWEVTNTLPMQISDMYVGFYVALSSFEGSEDRGGLAGTSDDESNGWLNVSAPCEGGVWIKDNPTGTTMALVSAASGLPLDQCYITNDDLFWPPNMADDNLIYTASNSPDQLEPAGTPEDKYVLVGWNLGDIPAGNKVALPLVIAFNTSEANVANDVHDALDFYVSVTAPNLEIAKTAEPSTIWLKGMGSPDIATVNLTIKGEGTPQVLHRPQDVVFLIDSSGSMAWNDPAYVRLDAANIYMQDMNSNDRAAIAPFGHDYDLEPNVNCVCIGGNWVCLPSFVPSGWLTDDMATPTSPAKVPHHLTSMDASGYATMSGDLWTLDAPDHPLTFFDPSCGTIGTGTNIEMAMQFAHEELIPGFVAKVTTGPPQINNARSFPSPGAKGIAGHLWVEILVTDGLPTHNTAATNDEVAYAASSGVKIYTIGLLGNVPEPQRSQAEAYLTAMATATGGAYYYANQPSDLIGIYDAIGTEIRSIAASPPQTPLTSMITDVLPDYIELASPITVDIGSVSTSPSPCVAGQICYINWSVNEDISIGEEHKMSYQIQANKPSPPKHNITEKPDAKATYLNWQGVEVSKPIPDVFITVLTPELQPPLITDIQVQTFTNMVNLTWVLSASSNVNAYDVYGGPSQTSIDFNTIIASTPDEVAPATQSWLQFPFDITVNSEYYFVVRSRSNTLPATRSFSSNTVGYFKMSFNQGTNTFALPLQPFSTTSLQLLKNDIGGTSISWLDANDDWQIYPLTLTPNARIGEGYIIEMPFASSYVFTGEPGAMIIYKDKYSWDYNAGSLVLAAVSGGNIDLTWSPLGADIEYYIYRSSTRDGFFTGAYSTLGPYSGSSYTDTGMASSAGELYYIVVPHNTSTGEFGSSTYSVGVFTVEYNGNEMFGLPLDRLSLGEKSADWYSDQIPTCLGMVYFESGIWKAHFKEFEEGAYDTTLTLGKGYELTVYSTEIYSHIGW